MTAMPTRPDGKPDWRAFLESDMEVTDEVEDLVTSWST